MPVVHARNHGSFHRPRINRSVPSFPLDAHPPEGPPDSPEPLFASSSSLSSSPEFGHDSLVYGTGVFLVLLLAYFSRRPLRSAVSRIAYGTATSFIHVHLHHSMATTTTTTTTVMTTMAQYSPLPLLVHTSDDREHDRLSSPLVCTSPREDPAPPYSPCASSAGGPSSNSRPLVDMSDRGADAVAEKSDLLRKVSTPISLPLIPQPKWISNVHSRVEPVPHHRPPPISTSRGPESPIFLLQTDSPCATPPPQYSSRSTSPSLSGGSTSRSGGVDASSFNSGPVPQYSITLYSSPRSFVHAYDGHGQPVVVDLPDIVLSPVPWLPSSDAYPTSSTGRTRRSSFHSASMAGGRRPLSPALGSPPGYLEVPSRKSRSRRHAEKEKEKEKGRGLLIMRPAPTFPIVTPVSRQRDPPSENEYRRDHLSWSTQLEKRHTFAATTINGNPPPVPPKSPARATTSGSASPMQRCHSLPLTKTTLQANSTECEGGSASSSLLIRSRSVPSIPPPRPVLPLDLEAVYPSEQQKQEQKQKQQHEKQALSRSNGRVGVVSSAVSYRDEKKRDVLVVDEKRQRESEGEDDVPLSKTLLLAMRKKTDELKSLKGSVLSSNSASGGGGGGEEKKLSSSLVTNMVKMQFFGRLGALAARAKMAIEKELDSDGEEDEKDEEEEMEEGHSRWEIAEQKEKEVMANVKHAQFLSRENAFVIGDEDE